MILQKRQSIFLPRHCKREREKLRFSPSVLEKRRLRAPGSHERSAAPLCDRHLVGGGHLIHVEGLAVGGIAMVVGRPVPAGQASLDENGFGVTRYVNSRNFFRLRRRAGLNRRRRGGAHLLMLLGAARDSDRSSQ